MLRRKLKISLIASQLLFASCTSVPERDSQKPTESRPMNGAYQEEGLASWYGVQFHGRRTASGERYDMHAMTAAHRSLPFGSQVSVTNLKNGKTVIVRINDRGPFTRGRIIDLSRAAARHLGIANAGITRVILKVINAS